MRGYNYAIHFENADSATANAQSVLILDTLDANVFDFSTFSLGHIEVGDTILGLPLGRRSHERLYNLIADQNVIVKITANFNDTTGVASWLFESLDPQTLTPVANPFDGFLPPNQTAPEGEGAVHYSVKLKKDLPNNTLIKNKAYIYFDSNPPIATQEWQNTLDNVRPHSQVDMVEVVGNDTTFNLSWSGTDELSGIRDYDIYVSKDDGPFDLWLINTDLTNASFTGVTGSKYCFYSVAADSASNVETAPPLPDVCTLNPGIQVSPVVFLQGAYGADLGLMDDHLRQQGLLPLTEPYTNLGYTQVGGGETVDPSVFEISGPEAIVDWVFLELRDKTDATIVLATRSALLQADGDVVDTDGISPITFADQPPDDYYLVVKHRNHLGVMSSTPVALSGSTTVIDFTTDLSNIYGGINGTAILEDGKLGLFSGDFNHNGQVQNTDYATMVLTLGTAGYLPGDFDLNGQVQNTDLQLKLLPNIGRGAAFP
jgi:hypothetical protein